ncbi:MAG: hypothetical protein ACRD18_07535 [Terriglobia bacterium]
MTSKTPSTKLRRRKTVQGLMTGKSIKDAALDAGYSQSMAKHNSVQLMDGIREEFAAELDKRLPRGEMIAELINLALGATKKERILNPKTGEVHEYEDVDSFARIKAAELLGKFGGLLIRREEGKVEHTVNLADVIAEARRRAKALPEPSSDVTVEAAPIKAAGPVNESGEFDAHKWLAGGGGNDAESST